MSENQEKLEQFLLDNFNNTTITKQVIQKRNLISTLEKEISELIHLEDEQLKKPWYQWKDAKFEIQEYDSYNSYCDTDLGKTTCDSYEEFASQILLRLYPHLRRNTINPNVSVFHIISPTGETYEFDATQGVHLPLVKEFIEREDLRKEVRAFDNNIAKLTNNVKQIQRQLDVSEMYSSEYLESLKNDLENYQSELNQALHLKEESHPVKRIDELNTILTSSYLFDKWIS